MTTAILSLIETIRTHLQESRNKAAGINQVLNRIEETLAIETELPLSPDMPSHFSGVINDAIERIPNSLLGPIARAIDTAKPFLRWRIDKGLYYYDDADVGVGYANGNMHCELIGPNNSPFHHDDFTLGLFMLAPGRLYRDHNHLAPEFYLNLTGPVKWRFDKGSWITYQAGSMIWNPPYQIHATWVEETPFLSIYSWTRDIGEKCLVVPANDWDRYEIE